MKTTQPSKTTSTTKEKVTTGLKTAANIATALAPTVILTVAAAVIIKKMESKDSE